MSKQYYYMLDEKVKGPLDEKAIALAIESGRLSSSVMISEGENALWKPFSEVASKAIKSSTQQKSRTTNQLIKNHKIDILEPLLSWSGRLLAILIIISYSVNLILSISTDQPLGIIGFWPYTLGSVFMLILACLLMAVSRIVTYLRIISEQ